jgi:RimJ/RimL family protein N-acetyltransferase
MTEVLPAVINYSSTVLQFETIIATLHTENIPSIKLLEKNNFKGDKARENQYYTDGGSLNEIVYSLKAM